MTETNNQEQGPYGQGQTSGFRDPDASSSRSELEHWFRDVRFPDVREAAVDYGNRWIERFYNTADAAAAVLAARWSTPAQGYDFIEDTLRTAFAEASPSDRSQWFLKRRYWASQIVRVFQKDDAVEALRRQQNLQLELEGAGGPTLVSLAVRHFPETGGTHEIVRDFLKAPKPFSEANELTFRREAQHIAKWLNDQFTKDPKRVWPMIKAFWPLVTIAPREELDQMYQLCRNEPDFRNFALSILEAKAHVPDADPHILWTFLDDFASEIPKEWLFKLAAARTPYSGSAGLFWLCALHKSDAKTLDLTLNIAKIHSDTWFRRFAFALAFSHYFDIPEAAEKLIDAAYAHEEDRNANRSVLTGTVSYNLPTSRPPNALAILHRVNATRFARSFNRICKNAGIDTGAPIPDDKNRAFLEIINSFLSGELAKPLVNAMVWASLSKSERATYRKSLESETFEKAQERKLKALDPADARGIAMWLDTAIGGSITQFGYRGRNSGRLIDKALEHLSSATTGHAADHLRMTRQHYDAVLRNVELLWHDPTTNALRRKYSSIETEIAERAYHRLLDGLNKDPDTAVLAALDDAVQCAQKS